jgi:CRP-like cAMP-binding protein
MLFYDLFRHSPDFKTIKSGEVLFREGDPGAEMYVLIEGKAEITIQGVSFDTIGQGDFVGELSVIDGSPRFATVTAKSDCRFVVVDKKRFHFLVDETPNFAIEVMRIMADRLRKADLRVVASAG